MLAGMTKEARWGEHVRAWRASGQTARAFAMSRGSRTRLCDGGRSSSRSERRQNVPPPSALARLSKPTTRSPSRARAVRPGEAVTDEDAIALVVGEITIAVRRGFDRALLREVVGFGGGAMLRSGVKIYLALEPIDVRLSFDRLSGERERRPPSSSRSCARSSIDPSTRTSPSTPSSRRERGSRPSWP
jgi:hypothetical protein